jgi:hypothetical protein
MTEKEVFGLFTNSSIKKEQKYFDSQGSICYTLISFALSDEPNPEPFTETLAG